MVERIPGLRRLRDHIARRVERPESYNLLQRSAGSDRVWEVFLGEHLKPSPGLRVLDVGCGPAEVLSFLPEVDYLGIDVHPPYISGARARYGDRGAFRVVEAAALAAEDPEPYDVVLLLGVLHHLSDPVAAEVLDAARRLLRPGGRLLTLDGCLVDGQARWARVLFWADRGEYIRDQAGYEGLLRPHLPDLRASLRHDLLRMPYTYLIMEATAPAG